MSYSFLLLPFFWLLNISIANAGELVHVTQKLSSSVQAGSDFTVEVTIHKADIIGFAKFQVELPEGFTATPAETKNGTFSFTDHKVKFIWMTLPADQEFKISYKIFVAPTATGIKSVGGTFAYVENNETQKVYLQATSISINKDASSTTNPSAASPATSTTETSETKTPETVGEIKKENTTVEKTINPTPNNDANAPAEVKKSSTNSKIVSSSTSSAQKSFPSIPTSSGIIFRVQLIAKQEDVGKEYFKQKYQIDAPVYMDNVDGRYKYTTGSLKTYSQAKDLCNKMKQQGVADAFVVAYRDNQRITVQEAIAATK